MKLADYLFRSGMSTTQLRRALGVSCRSTITRYLNGERIPRHDVMQRIIDLSGGKVQLHDFLRGGNPECATVITAVDGRQRLVFPWSTRRDDLDAAEELEQRRTANDNLQPAVLRSASSVLRGRAVVHRNAWHLDGRPADAKRVVRAANLVLRANGRPVLHYPGLEEV
jgi:hypothetical protein